MSYILDALKKSERERGRGSVPNVQTIHTAGLNYKNEKKQIWPYILIGIVALNLAALLFFIISDDNKTTASVAQIENPKEQIEEQADTLAEPVNPSMLSEQMLPVTNEPAPKPESVKQPEVAAPSVAIASNKHASQNATPKTTEKNIDTAVDIHELPSNIQQLFPEITFQAHVYSSNPAQRSVVINNQFMEEGQYVIDGLLISEITPNGVIFGFMGYQISSGVVSNWDIN